MTFTEQAKAEIKRVGLLDADSDYAGGIGKALNELLDVFQKQGHSGMSAQRTAQLFYQLVKNGGKFVATHEDL